ncbi:uncharacterized protein [Medicago truncatula]|uniref:uncharacterized protein n=1 Tax=Medicago truncatula TaxID=3880 RepID=UPI0019679F55|nr:uncharacterized protein LOC11418629 [Medicago truncatula]
MASFLTDLAKSYVVQLINGVISESSYICCFPCIANDSEEERARLEIESTTVKQRVDGATRRGEDEFMNEQQSLEAIDTTIKSSQGNKLEGSTSDKLVGAKNEPPVQQVSPKQKGVEISVEEGTTSANANTKTSSPHSKEDGDVTTQDVDVKLWQETSNTNINQAFLNDDVAMKVSSNIQNEFPKDEEILVSKSRLSCIPSQSPSKPSEGDPSQLDEDLISSLVVTRELENLVSKNHLAIDNMSLLTNFLVNHPSILLTDASLSNRYKGYAYNCLAELLKFLQTHIVLDVLGSSQSEFVELLQDVRKCGFDKDWLDRVEKRALFPDLQFSQNALQKILDSQQNKGS